MQGIFESLTRAVQGAPALALFAAFAWGVLSVVLSPCHLASIPLIVGYVSGQSDPSPRTGFRIAGSFALGILATIALIGVATSMAGRMLGDVGSWTNYAVAAVFFATGLHLLGVFEFRLPGPTQAGTRLSGHGGAFILGAVFGTAMGPCTFAYMAPVLAASVKVGATSPLMATSLLLSFGLGHCSVIVGAGTSTRAAQTVLDWGATGNGASRVKGACGALVLLAGLYMVFTAS